MSKFWSILFGVVMALCGLSFIVAPFVGWWLPDGVSTHAGSVDNLFYLILWVTGFFFFLTEAILVVFMFKYTSEGTPKPTRNTAFPALLKPLEGVLHDAHRVEMAWTLVPALILLLIAFVQVNTWAEVKYQKNMPDFASKDAKGAPIVPNAMDVSARQFEWRVRYPHPERIRRWQAGAKANSAETKKDYESFHRVRQADDVDDVNAVHTWVGQPTVVYLSTRDVIHSFNIPMMRVKQDALPGKLIPVWFVPTRANTALARVDKVTHKAEVANPEDSDNEKYEIKYVDGAKYDNNGKFIELGDHASRWDIPCAELCGWGHYRMIGRVYVHKDVDSFMSWLEQQEKRSHATTGPR